MPKRTIAVLALLVAAACGKKPETTATPTETTASAPAPPSSAASDITPVAGQPCTHTTEAEVTEIVGHPMKFATAKPNECNLLSASGDATKSVAFQIQDDKTLFDTMTAGPGFEPLSGVGDKAVVAPTTAMVIAVKNNRVYIGSVYLGADTAQAKEKSVALASKIVPRL